LTNVDYLFFPIFIWLKNAGQDDFCSKDEAMQIYLAAIKEIA